MATQHRSLVSALALAAALSQATALADDKPFEAGLSDRLEQRTPAGRVPPPPATTLRAPALADEQPSIAEPADDDTASADAVVQAFAAAYRKAGSPRLAVYFNRALSDEIREWIPGDHLQADLQMTHSASGHSLATGPVSGQSTTSVKADIRSRQYVGATGGRQDPREAWKWEFEDAITSLFLQGNAKVVDRAVIFRQMAKQAPQTAGMDGSTSTNLNEISALDKFADILVETQVTRSRSATGYDFRATAKNVKTGQILGTAFVNGRDDDENAPQRYVATSRGYEKQEFDPELTVEKVSRQLTLKLMRSLTAQLGR